MGRILKPTWQIFVPRHYFAAHSFDLWDVLVKEKEAGRKELQTFRDNGVSWGLHPDEVTRRGDAYQAYMNGEAWTIATPHIRQQILEEVALPLQQNGFYTPYSEFFYDDALEVMNQIVNAGEKIIIATSVDPVGLRDHLPLDINDGVVGIYGEKKNSAMFQRAYRESISQNVVIVSHTADQFGELMQARDSGVIPVRIFVNRKPSLSLDEACAQGFERDMTIVTNDLTQIPYLQLTRRDDELRQVPGYYGTK